MGGAYLGACTGSGSLSCPPGLQSLETCLGLENPTFKLTICRRLQLHARWATGLLPTCFPHSRCSKKEEARGGSSGFSKLNLGSDVPSPHLGSIGHMVHRERMIQGWEYQEVAIIGGHPRLAPPHMTLT